MTVFNEQFNELVKVTLVERQHLQDQTDNDENIQAMDKSAKSRDCFQDNKDINTLQEELNLEISYPTLLTLVSTKRIIITRILFSKFICY